MAKENDNLIIFGILAVIVFLIFNGNTSNFSIIGIVQDGNQIVRPIENYQENISSIPMSIETVYKGQATSAQGFSICGDNDGRISISNDYSVSGDGKSLTISSSMSSTHPQCTSNYIKVNFTAPYNLSLSGQYELYGKAESTPENTARLTFNDLVYDIYADDSVSGIGPRPIDQESDFFQKNYTQGEEIVIILEMTKVGEGNVNGETTFTINQLNIPVQNQTVNSTNQTANNQTNTTHNTTQQNNTIIVEKIVEKDPSFFERFGIAGVIAIIAIILIVLVSRRKK